MGLLDNLVNYTLHYWHSLSEHLDAVESHQQISISMVCLHLNYLLSMQKAVGPIWYPVVPQRGLHPTRNNHLLA